MLDQKRIKIKAYSAWVAICIIWGTTYLAIRIGVEGMPPFLFASPRWILAGIIYLVILKFRGYSFPKKSDYKHILIVGLLLLGVGNGMVVVAEKWIPSGLAALLMTTVPFVIILFESLLFKKNKLNSFTISGIGIGFLGVLIILGSNLNELFNTDNKLGVMFIFIGLTAWGGGSVYSKYNKISVHPFMGAAFQMLFAGIFQLIIGLLLGEATNFYMDYKSFLALIYLFVFGSMIGYASYMFAIDNLPVSFVSTYTYINPVIALFVGWLFLNEELSIEIILSASIILIGIYLVNKGNKLV